MTQRASLHPHRAWARAARGAKKIDDYGDFGMPTSHHAPRRDSHSVLGRRQFLHHAGTGAALGAAACLAPWSWAGDATTAAPAAASQPESIVKLLYESLTPGQREKVCFDWNHQDKEKGLLRTRIENNWLITEQTINSDFYTGEQRELVAGILKGIISPEWHERIYKEQKDDSGGFGQHNSIAIFGKPGEGQSEFVLTGRHMTLRCDGNSTEHVAFGGPIFYGHAAQGFDEKPDHPGNVFWPQAVAANSLYKTLDGKQQKLALIKSAPWEGEVEFKGKGGQFEGIPVAELSADQKARVQEVLQKLIEPYRQSDRDEVVACLKTQGGLDACHLAFYQDEDIGDDGVWDIWRIEGPSFVWHYRGAPHVHVWVNVADDAGVKLNA
jgi:hypothetical protein